MVDDKRQILGMHASGIAETVNYLNITWNYNLHDTNILLNI